MKSLNKLLLERLVAHRPSRALRLSAARLDIRRVTLHLPQASPLFRRDDGEFLELPLDEVIAPAVLDQGAWSMEEVSFLTAHAPKQPAVLIDVGANIGLMTRQLMHALPGIAAAVCYEPHPLNFEPLSRNVAHLRRCCLVQAAVSDRAGQMSFYEDTDNIGNYSLNIDSMRGRRYRTSVVQCLRASDAEFLGRLPPGTSALPIIWKSDTQGSDELIVTSLSDDFWSRVHAAGMEISRIHRPDFDHLHLARILERFPIRRFGSRPGRLSVADVLQYAAGSDGLHEELLLAKEERQQPYNPSIS